MEIKLPRFDNFDFVTEFNLFGEFLGQFYSLVLWKSCQSFHQLAGARLKNLASESEVHQFLQAN